jgi:hypothetical protein
MVKIVRPMDWLTGSDKGEPNASQPIVLLASQGRATSDTAIVRWSRCWRLFVYTYLKFLVESYLIEKEAIFYPDKPEAFACTYFLPIEFINDRFFLVERYSSW